MDKGYYLDKFQHGLVRLNGELFREKQLELKVGTWLNSVALKIQKKAWVNLSPTAKPFQESIFFSIWVNAETIRQGKLYYNIHALKLRELTYYTIKSRDFAEAFRLRFKQFEAKWPNINLGFGPLTLMEGWISLDENNIEKDITQLAYLFLEITPIIDELLSARKK
jgi:hypothetical protein